MNKIKSFIFMLSFIYLTSCYSDSNIGPNDYNKTNNNFEASVSGDFKLEFKTKAIYYEKGDSISKISATMIVSPFEIYSFDIAFKDSMDKYTFNISSTDTLTNFKVFFGHLVKHYYFKDIEGKLMFTKRTNDTIEGEFNFTAKDSLLDKSVNIKSGAFFYILKKK